MKIATNITREPLAGITTTTINLLNHLHGTDTSFIGIELNAYRTFKSPAVYRHLSPEWFNHYIVSICDLSMHNTVKKADSLKKIEKEYRLIIDYIKNILEREKPDIVLIQGTYYIPWLISIAAQELNLPMVLWYAGVLTKEVEHMPPKFRKMYTAMEKSIVKRAGQIIFPSQVCKDAVQDCVMKNETVRHGVVIPNPISPIFTKGKKIEVPVQNSIALIGRYTPIKNVSEFCRLHEILLKRGWRHTATIVSDVNEKYLKDIPETIRLIPSMQPHEIRTFYATQGLIISTSHFETFGNVPIEAACTGIPVLVSKNMGCAEVLKAAELERMVFDFSDPEKAADRIIELCGQHILPRQINNLKKKVDARYVANEIMSVLNGEFKKSVG